MVAGSYRHAAMRRAAALLLVLATVTSCSHGQSHAEWCRSYKDALVLAYDDPTDSATPAGLPAEDTRVVLADRALWQKDATPRPASNGPLTGTPIPPDPSLSRAQNALNAVLGTGDPDYVPAYDPDVAALRRYWASQAAHTVKIDLAKHGC